MHAFSTQCDTQPLRSVIKDMLLGTGVAYAGCNVNTMARLLRELQWDVAVVNVGFGPHFSTMYTVVRVLCGGRSIWSLQDSVHNLQYGTADDCVDYYTLLGQLRAGDDTAATVVYGQGQALRLVQEADATWRAMLPTETRFRVHSSALTELQSRLSLPPRPAFAHLLCMSVVGAQAQERFAAATNGLKC